MNKPTILPDGIAIPSSTDFLADVDQYLEKTLIDAGVDPSAVADIAISVSELVNNAIIHGNKENLSKRVEITINISPSEVKITVVDEGSGFDPDNVPNPIDDENLMREVGRGLFIIQNFVDEVNVASAPSGGTSVEIVKKR